MEKERKVKKLALVAVIVAVLGMTIAFAALSQTLTISGTANTEAAIWDVHFGTVSTPNLIGTATTSYTGLTTKRKPKISEDGTEITDVRATLKKPGDEVRYTSTIENEGTIAAEIASIEIPSLTAEQKEIFDFSVIYTEDGKEVSVGDVLPGWPSFDDDVECDACSQAITIKVRYKDITDESLLPEEAQEIQFSYKINYVQSDKKDLYHAGNKIFGVELSNGQTPVTIGTATATTPTLVGNTLQDYTVTLSDIGDKAVYTFDITNIADHTVTVSLDNDLYEDDSNACYGNRSPYEEHPECAKFDFNGDGAVTPSDSSTLGRMKSKLVGSDGSNKIGPNATKTFTITSEIRSNETSNFTKEPLTVLKNPSIVVQ